MADTKFEINCPACGKKMIKVGIEAEKCSVDICLDGCGGIFFDNRELEKFDELHENAEEILNQIKEKTFERINEEEIRVCPVCNTLMVKNGAGKGGLVIDVCNVCGGKFLDNGELQTIRNSDIDKSNDEIINEELRVLFDENLKEVADDNNILFNLPASERRRGFFVNIVKKML